LIGIADALRLLKTSEQVSYILDSSLKLTYCNKAWDKFARQNSAPHLAGGTAIGQNLLSVTHKSLRPFYSNAFRSVTRENKVWESEYECSSPLLFRKFLMRVHPITPNGWFLVTNSILVELGHAPSENRSVDYADPDGQISLCVHCRCSKRIAPPERWDFVPSNLKPNMTNIKQDLCPLCREYFYPSHRS